MSERQSQATMNTSPNKPDDSEPTPKRQGELRAAYDMNVAMERDPYADVEIRTLGEVLWIQRERGWATDEVHFRKHRADFNRAHLSAANLSGLQLLHGDLREGQLTEVNLSGALLLYTRLSSADMAYSLLSGANLDSADLRGANMAFSEAQGTNFAGTDLRGANLSCSVLHGASFNYANLSGTNLAFADLRGADLTNAMFDGTTNLTSTTLDSTTMVRDVAWNGASIGGIAWELIDTLGEEEAIPSAANDRERLYAYEAAARAYRQLATALRSQGLNEHADRFVYRAQLCRRVVLRLQGVRKWPAYLGSLILWAVAGYGYNLWRIAAAYVGILVLFSLLYMFMGVHSHAGEPGIQAFWDSFLVSLSSIHGRTLFEQLGAWSPAAWVAAIESVFGIVIEGIFVAMLIQRFFSR